MTDYFKTVLPFYLEPHRFYHNSHHLMDILERHDLYKNVKMQDTVHGQNSAISESNSEVIYYATLFHDIVYNIKKETISNEVLSAELFYETVKYDSKFVYGMASTKLTCDVINCIKATEFHFTDNNYNLLTSYFMDLDIMGLATYDLDKLILDNENIDKEYMLIYNKEYVYNSRFNYIKNYMKPFARFRAIDNVLLNQKLHNNIEFLLEFYMDKL
jgi:predicted metal-dependent HD superfamily phosphohydrolase